MSFDSKRFIKDYCRHPFKTKLEALRGEYNRRKVYLTKAMIYQRGGFHDQPELVEEWLASDRNNLTTDAVRAVREILRCSSAEIYADVEADIFLSLHNFKRWQQQGK